MIDLINFILDQNCKNLVDVSKLGPKLKKRFKIINKSTGRVATQKLVKKILKWEINIPHIYDNLDEYLNKDFIVEKL